MGKAIDLYNNSMGKAKCKDVKTTLQKIKFEEHVIATRNWLNVMTTPNRRNVYTKELEFYIYSNSWFTQGIINIIVSIDIIIISNSVIVSL